MDSERFGAMILLSSGRASLARAVDLLLASVGPRFAGPLTVSSCKGFRESKELEASCKLGSWTAVSYTHLTLPTKRIV